MAADRIVEGWKVFERWAKRFKERAAVDDSYAYCLSSSDDVSHIFGMSPGDLDLNDFEYPSDSQERIRHRLGFLRDYFLDISFDGGDFHASVKKLLSCQAPRACPVGYTIWLGVSEIDAWLPQDTSHFGGLDSTLFCRDINDYDFASVMNIAPFDKISVRQKRGADWSRADEAAFLDNLRDDLASDGIEVKISHYYEGPGYSWGPLLAAWIRVTEPRNIYFDYRATNTNPPKD